MWNERYAGDDYLFGTEPAAFLHRAAEWLRPGATALAIADGEGRNSVWLAEQGLTVAAFDPAPNALAKARKLAAARGVVVDYHLADLDGWDWSRVFDVVVGIFIQFVGPEDRELLFGRIKQAVKPGGLVLLQGYTPKQLQYRTGGPSAVENLYTEALLREAFADFELLVLKEYEDELSEGSGHCGRSAVIDLIARRPA